MTISEFHFVMTSWSWNLLLTFREGDLWITDGFLSQMATSTSSLVCSLLLYTAMIQYIPRNMHTVFALLWFVVVIHWLIFPYPSGLLHWHCGNLTIAPVPAKQPWWIWINTSCEFIMNDCITTTKQSTTKPCAYFLGYCMSFVVSNNLLNNQTRILSKTRTRARKTFISQKNKIQNNLNTFNRTCISFSIFKTWSETNLRWESTLLKDRH